MIEGVVRDWAGKLSLVVHFDNERGDGGGCLPEPTYIVLRREGFRQRCAG